MLSREIASDIRLYVKKKVIMGPIFQLPMTSKFLIVAFYVYKPIAFIHWPGEGFCSLNRLHHCLLNPSKIAHNNRESFSSQKMSKRYFRCYSLRCFKITSTRNQNSKADSLDALIRETLIRRRSI